MQATAAAVRVLRGLLEKGQTLDSALDQVVTRSAPNGKLRSNRAWLQEVCYGVTRNLLPLEALLERLAERPTHRLDGAIRALLLIGLYRMWRMRAPSYAAIHTTVQTCALLRRLHSRGLVNAVLRRFQREGEAHLADLQQRPELRYAHPEWLLQATRAAWPQQWKRILQANNCQAPLWLRVNRQRTTRADYQHRLSVAGHPGAAPARPEQALMLKSPVLPTQLPGFAEGDCSVQDGAAQFACRALRAAPGMRVLDACAAPGGKGAHLLECVADLKLLALERKASRLERLRENWARLGLNAATLAADATQPGDWWDGKLFDRILLDAPCSGTGVIRRRPDIKLRKTPASLEKLRALQDRLLHKLWDTLAPGGLLLYVSCSYLPEENDGPIASLCDARPKARKLKLRIPYSLPTRYGCQLLPGTGHMDGFYYALLAHA